MNERMMRMETTRSRWSPQEAALSEALQEGLAPHDPTPLPDPETILLLAEVLGPEPPPLPLPIRILTSWEFLAVLGSLPIALWVVRRWEEWGLDLSVPLEVPTLIAIGRALADAGTPGWETGLLLLGFFLYLTWEYALNTRHRI